MNSIQNKLTLIIIVGLLVTTSLSGFIIFKYEKLIGSMVQLSNEVSLLQASAYNSQIYFKTQIQEWKNTLLRGYDKKLYKKYHNSFLLYEKKTSQEVQKLSLLAEKYPELKSSAIKFIHEHKKLSTLYSEGLIIYNKTKYEPQIFADNHVRGIDREPIKLLSHIVKLSEKIYALEENNKKDRLNRIKFIVVLVYIITFTLLIIFFWISVKKGITQPLKKDTLKNHQLAMTDSLTEISNRHAYNNKITYQIDDYCFKKKPFTLVVFDIDKFKSINDNYGHLIGDKILKSIAQILKNNIRESDFIARYGGEEFVIILPDSNINAAECIANKLRQLIECSEYFFNNERVIVTASAGLAEIKINESKEELFQRADKALYKAKKLGRNQCIKG